MPRKPNPEFEILEFLVNVTAESFKAWRVACTQIVPEAFWVPRSQVTMHPAPDGLKRMEIPRWLAREKGLLPDES